MNVIFPVRNKDLLSCLFLSTLQKKRKWEKIIQIENILKKLIKYNSFDLKE